MRKIYFMAWNRLVECRDVLLPEWEEKAGFFDINLEIEVYNVMTMLYNKSTKYRRGMNMANTSLLQVRTSSEDKEKASEILEKLGTNLSAVVNMMIKQIILTIVFSILQHVV